MKRQSTHALALRATVVCMVVLAGPGRSLAANIVDLGNLGGGSSTPNFINLEGDVSGISFVAGDVMDSHAFFYSGITGATNGMQDIGTFGASSSIPLGLNANGQISGTAGSVAFLYDGPSGQSFRLFPHNVGFGNSLNDSGVVAASEISGGIRAVLVNQTGTIVDNLGTNILGGFSAEADFVTNNLQVAGKAATSGNRTSQAFYSPVPDPQTGARSYTALSFGFDSNPTGMNQQGVVIGVGSLSSGSNPTQHGFVYDPNAQAFTELFLQNPNNFVGGSDAEAVNASGEVVGKSAISATQTHAYLYTVATGVTDLGTLMADNSGNSIADGINSNGWIVGTATSPTGTDPFIDIAGVMYDLNTAAYRGTFQQLLTAVGINDNGLITGVGINSLGNRDAYVLNFNAIGVQAPEPATITSFAAAFLLCFGGIRMRRGYSKRYVD